jgi:hypothetical protein
MKQLPMTAPLHNSIAPFTKLRQAGVRIYLGVDNVHDLFMPMVDGDIWTECRMLMEACRFYDIDQVAEWACAKPITAGTTSKSGEIGASAKKAAGTSTPQPAARNDEELAAAAPARKRAAGGPRRG